MNNQNSLTLDLSLDEVNTILTALGNRPYAKVYQLVQKIQGQAAAQVRQAEQQVPIQSPIKNINDE